MKKRKKANNRVPTGIPELDSLIEGGFISKSVILLAGSPGAGKTTLSAKFIYEGATKYGSPGVYACFAESKDTFLWATKRFGCDFEDLIRKNMVSILDLAIGVEIEIQASLNMIMESVLNLGAERLVIDSITALLSGLDSDLKKRHLTRLLYKLVKKSGCTTIVIVDMPWGVNRIGAGIEEFITDGIILMTGYYDEKGHLRRYLRIPKMRGTNHSLGTYEYTIDEHGIHIKTEAVEKDINHQVNGK